DVESFLWTLDGGWREDKAGKKCDIDSVRKSLSRPKEFVTALQVPNKKRRELDRALNGLYKFVQFCEQFDLLLIELREEPDVAEAMWLHHAYWFMQFATEVGGSLQNTLKALNEWEMPRKDRASLNARVREVEEVIRALSIPPLAVSKSDPN